MMPKYCDYDADGGCIFFFDDADDNPQKSVTWVASRESAGNTNFTQNNDKFDDRHSRRIPYINMFAKRRRLKESRCSLVPRSQSASIPDSGSSISGNSGSSALRTEATLSSNDKVQSMKSMKSMESKGAAFPMHSRQTHHEQFANALNVKEVNNLNLAEVQHQIKQQMRSLDKLQYTLQIQAMAGSTQQTQIKAVSALRSNSDQSRVRLPRGYYTEYHGVNGVDAASKAKQMQQMQQMHQMYQMHQMQQMQQMQLQTNGVGLQSNKSNHFNFKFNYIDYNNLNRTSSSNHMNMNMNMNMNAMRNNLNVMEFRQNNQSHQFHHNVCSPHQVQFNYISKAYQNIRNVQNVNRYYNPYRYLTVAKYL